MKLKVLHKGLIIVALPLTLEFAIIGSLGYLLGQSDQAYRAESIRSFLTLNGGRVVFADSKAGCMLGAAWRERNPQLLVEVNNQIIRLEQICKQLAEMSAMDEPELQIKHEYMLERQKILTGYLQQIVDIGLAGMEDLESLKKVIRIRRVLMKELALTFEGLGEFYRMTDASLEKVRKRLRDIQSTENLVLALGLVANLFAATFAYLYFRKNFVGPVARIGENVNRLSRGEELLAPLYGTDEICELDGAFHEMDSELRRAAEREATLFNNTSDVILIVEESFQIVRVNAASETLWGVLPAELSGKDAETMCAGDSQLRTMLEKAREDLLPVVFEQTCRHVSGQMVETLWSVFWSHKQSSWYCIVADVSTERQLASMRQQFLKLIAADFQKPLSHMSELLSGLQTRQDLAVPETCLSKVSTAGNTLSRLVGLVDDLLELETLQGATMRLDLNETSIAEVVQGAVSDVEALAGAKKINIGVLCERDFRLTIDKNKVIRVLVNFLSNAVKFSPEGSFVEIRVTSEGNQLRLAVTDKGRGIPADAMSGLFQPFKQTSAADGKRGKGTGLGLVVCKRIVEQHGGQVGASSVPGQGSTFWLTLPILHTAGGAATVKMQGADVAAALESGSASGQAVKFPKSRGGDTEGESGRASLRTSAKGLSLKQKGFLLIGVPLIFELSFVAAMTLVLFESGKLLNEVLSSRLATSTVLRMTMNFYDATLVARKATASSFDARHFSQSVDKVPGRIATFKALAERDENIGRAAPEILKMAEHIYSQLKEFRKIATDDSKSLTADKVKQVEDYLFDLTDKLGDKTQTLIAVCEARDPGPEVMTSMRTWQSLLLGSGLVINCLVSCGMAVFFSRDVASRLRVLAANSARLSRSEPLEPLVRGRDEIAAIDRAFHETAEKLIAEREKERAFLDYSPSIIAALDAEGRFTASNAACARITELATEEIMLRPLADIVVAEGSKAVVDALSAARESAAPYRFDTTIATPDGAVELQWTVSWSAKENTFFAVAHDITARKELERMKREFLALITHDLRTPLTTIYGMMGLGLAGALGQVGPEVKSVFEAVKQECMQILELVNDLLDMEKLEAGQLKLEFANVDLLQVAELAKKLAAERVAGVDVVIENIGPSVGVAADLDRLAHALSSVIIEGKSISKSLRLLLTRDSNEIHVNVVCEGSSQNPELTANVIEQFESEQEVLKSDRGSRLRVPLAKRILKSHNARFELNRDKGDLAFVITLPAAQSSAGN